MWCLDADIFTHITNYHSVLFNGQCSKQMQLNDAKQIIKFYFPQNEQCHNDWVYSLFKSITIVITSECLRIINMEKAVSRRQTNIPTYSRALHSFVEFVSVFCCQNVHCLKPQVFLHNILLYTARTHDYFHSIWVLTSSKFVIQIFKFSSHFLIRLWTFQNCVCWIRCYAAAYFMGCAPTTIIYINCVSFSLPND